MSIETDTTSTAGTGEPLAFFLLAECENCEADIYYGPCMSLLDEHRGLPVITYDLAAQTNFRCDRCGASNYTGDFEMYCEGGDDSVDEDDDSDDDV